MYAVTILLAAIPLAILLVVALVYGEEAWRNFRPFP